jgi:CBS domain-containing protein
VTLSSKGRVWRQTTPALDESQEHVIGVMTEFDLVEAIQTGKELNKTTAEEIMTNQAVTADVDTVSQLLKIMTDSHVIRLPITAKGKLVCVLLQ